MKSIIQHIRKIRFRLLSKMKIVNGIPIIAQPALFCGKGKITFNGTVNVGYSRSPCFFSGYCYFEVRTLEATILIEDGTYINNNFAVISEGAGIEIGKQCLIGPGVSIFDSDFHGLVNRSEPQKSPIHIGDNVFIGANAIILKGVTIGNNSTIAAGAVVAKDIPANVVAAGNPAKVIKELA